MHFRRFHVTLEFMESLNQQKPTGKRELSVLFSVVVGHIQIGITVPGPA